MIVGDHRGRKIALSDTQFKIEDDEDPSRRFPSFAAAKAAIDKDAQEDAIAKRLSLPAIALTWSQYSGGGTAGQPLEVTITGVNRGSRQLTLSKIPKDRDVREVYVKHPEVERLIAKREELREALSLVERSLSKLRVHGGRGYGRLDTAEAHALEVDYVVSQHASSLVAADLLAQGATAEAVR